MAFSILSAIVFRANQVHRPQLRWIGGDNPPDRSVTSTRAIRNQCFRPCYQGWL